MFQASLSTAMSRANRSEARDSFDVETTPEDIIQPAMARLDPEARHGIDAGLSTDMRRSEVDANIQNIQSSFTDHGNAYVGLSRIANLPRLPTRRVPAARLHALQEWEGYVVEIGEEEFTARLTDVTARASYEQEEAVIPLAEVSDDDAAKMCEGSIFRWVIGYERSAAGTKKRVSQIVFRDLPAITEADLRASEVWAREMMGSFGP